MFGDRRRLVFLQKVLRRHRVDLAIQKTRGGHAVHQQNRLAFALFANKLRTPPASKDRPACSCSVRTS